MAFEDHQVTKIQREILELQALNLEMLTQDQKTGHYQKVVELLEVTIAQGNKELSTELLTLGTAFDPKGQELGKMTEQIEALTAAPDPPATEDTPAEGDQGEPAAEAPALKRTIEEVRESTKKLRKGPIRNSLLIVLEENSIVFEEDDTDDILMLRIDAWLAGTEYVPVVPIALKRSPEDVSDAMEAEGRDVSHYRIVLIQVLDENYILSDNRDSDEQLQERIDAYLEEREPDIDHPVIVHTIDRAKELSTELSDYVKTMGDQMRLEGKDVVRYKRFAADLDRISRQRLV